MPAQGPSGRVFNRTRQVCLASKVQVAGTHWTRLRGLMFRDAATFCTGQGLWIIPSRGIHTFAMRFPIDAAYLDRNQVVVDLQLNLKPWRLGPVRVNAASVLELPENTLSSSGTQVGDQLEITMQQASEAVLV